MAERYATIAQVESKVPEIADNTFWSDAKIIEQENFAAAEIDSVLRSVYTVPFSAAIASTPVQIQELCAILTAIKILKIEYRKNGHNESKYVEELTKEYDKLIKEYKEGTRSLVSVTGVAVSRLSSEVSSSTQNVEPVFGMGQDGEFESDRDDWENVKEAE